jgi:hypothetical protein
MEPSALEKKELMWNAEVVLMDDISAITEDLEAQAEQIRRRNNAYAHIAWWASALLFAFGWGLGLLGKLYGVPEAAGGE